MTLYVEPVSALLNPECESFGAVKNLWAVRSPRFGQVKVYSKDLHLVSLAQTSYRNGNHAAQNPLCSLFIVLSILSSKALSKKMFPQ